MATIRPNGNPYSNFNFIVEADGVELGGFTEVSGLDSENQPIEYREGSDVTNAPRKLPGVEAYPTVTLKRGITGNLDLWNWRQEVRDGTGSFPPTRTVTVKLLNEQSDRDAPAMTWTLTNAWPSKLSGPQLSAKGNEIAVEQLDLCVDRVDVS